MKFNNSNIVMGTFGVFRRWGFLQGIITMSSIVFSKIKLVSKKRADEDYRLRLAEINGYKIKRNKNEWILLKGQEKIFCRKYSSDLDVMDQIFFKNEFKNLFELIITNRSKINTIIDAGSNIGLTSILLSKHFPGSSIICLEPDSENFKQQEKNFNANNINAHSLQMGLWKDNRKLYLNRNFRDGKEWSISLIEESNNDEHFIESISLNSLKERFNLSQIDLLKMDIEGSEKVIFEVGSNTDFLSYTKFLAVEIHDEFNCRENIIDVLRRNKFSFINSGEYLIASNDLLNK